MAEGIGILDSGVGGLTVVREVMRQLPREEVIYIGDSARCPYGSRPIQEIRQFAMQMVQFLLQFEPKAIVVACNTVTAVLLHDLKNMLSIPVIGVIESGARAAIRVTKNNNIGVIGTQGTIQSNAYQNTLLRIHPELKVFSLACPAFVPLVECGTEYADVLPIVQQELFPLQHLGIDTLILGCTHYPIIADIIGEVMGEQVTLISSADETASELSFVLSQMDQLVTSEQFVPQHRFYTTGDPISFRNIAENWLKRDISVEQVTLSPMQMV